MIKTHWKIRFLYWYAKKILRVPIIVEFTPDFMDTMFGVGFAWSNEAANRMRGDDRLAERVRNAEMLASQAKMTRSARRLANRAAMKAAKKVIKK